MENEAEYRVEELAQAAGIRVDTLRFYQGQGLLPPPRRQGRIALYRDEHLDRLRQIRELQQQGFTLAQIRRLPREAPQAEESEPLLHALVEERVGSRSLTRSELASEAGVPEVLVAAVEAAGLIEPLRVEGEELFSEADLEMARAGLALLESGFPLQELMGHAVTHAGQVQELCDAAIDLFDRHVRQRGPAANDAEAITAVFQLLLPKVTRLVALHFQRTLVARALNRLRGRGELDALQAALEATDAARLEVEVSWR
jgi:DNA-binding transcriptional MerR regulator